MDTLIKRDAREAARRGRKRIMGRYLGGLSSVNAGIRNGKYSIDDYRGAIGTMAENYNRGMAHDKLVALAVEHNLVGVTHSTDSARASVARVIIRRLKLSGGEFVRHMADAKYCGCRNAFDIMCMMTALPTCAGLLDFMCNEIREDVHNYYNVFTAARWDEFISGATRALVNAAPLEVYTSATLGRLRRNAIRELELSGHIVPVKKHHMLHESLWHYKKIDITPVVERAIELLAPRLVECGGHGHSVVDVQKRLYQAIACTNRED